MDVLANNLTNVDTTAYKSDALISSTFKDMMLTRINDPDVVSVSKTAGPLGVGTHIESLYTSFVQGAVEQTGRPCDFALTGEGFFVVSTSEGERYTRSGSFSVTSDGYLVNGDGLYVQGENGNIHVDGDNFTVDEQGNVYVDGTITDKLRIVTFEDLTGLRKQGNNLYYNSTDAQVQEPPADTQVIQGALEGSNVDIAEEVTRLMVVSNAYQINQRVLGMVDESLSKTVNEVGRIG
jgi:flagellar basal-body rod protein FlgG